MIKLYAIYRWVCAFETKSHPISPSWCTYVVYIIGTNTIFSYVPKIFDLKKKKKRSILLTTGSVVLPSQAWISLFILKYFNFHIGFILIPSIPVGLQNISVGREGWTEGDSDFFGEVGISYLES